MHKIFKIFIPPIILNFIIIIKNTIIKNLNPNILIKSYDNSTIANIVIQKNMIFRDTIASNKILDIQIMKSFTGIAIAAFNEKKTFKVLDFGGGGGYHYFISKLLLPQDILISWHIVETSSIVKQSNDLTNTELKFFNTIEEASFDIQNFDLIFASSSLQYCKNQSILIEQILNLNATNIYITRTPFSENRIVDGEMQHSLLSANGPGDLPVGFKDSIISYPIYINNLDNFTNLFLKKYNIKFKINEEKNAFIIRNKSFHNYGIYFQLK
jgi:putative methyltransferase (TIGR04325 family)